MSITESAPKTRRNIDASSQILAWCASVAKNVEPIPERDVPGTTDGERKLLRALGGVAGALATEVTADTSLWPKRVRAWIDSPPSPERDLIALIMDRLSAGEEVLASAYERIVSGRNRRRLGTFFTPEEIMAYIRGLIARLDISPAIVSDPGAGVGAFTISALNMWPRAQVYAVDVNLVTLGLLAAAPTPSTHGGVEGRLALRHEDFLLWLQDEWQRLPGPKLIFGNPPYTRHQLLDSSEKMAAAQAAGPLAPTGRSGLSTYFLAASLNALGDTDGLCLLLPVNWLETDYARPVRRHLWEETGRTVELHLFPDDEHVFPAAQVAAMILFVGPRLSEPQNLSVFQTERTEHGHGFAAELKITLGREGPCPSTFMPSGLAANLESSIDVSDDTIQLGEIATVRRGVATGNNKFFLRKDKEIVGLPSHTYVPALARLREIEADELTTELHQNIGEGGERCWMLRLTESDRTDPAIAYLLAKGERDSIHEAYLCKVREVWYELEKIPIPHLILSPMSKKTFRVLINTLGAVPTNTLYGIRLIDGIDNPDNRRRLAEWLRCDDGQAALRAVARRHGDGLLKLEPKALLTVRIPIGIVAVSTQQDSQLAAF